MASKIISALVLLFVLMVCLFIVVRNDVNTSGFAAKSIIKTTTTLRPPTTTLLQPVMIDEALPTASIAPGILIVKFTESSGVTSLSQAIAKFQQITPANTPIVEVTNVYHLNPTLKTYEVKKKLGMDRVYQIKVNENTDLTALASQYAANSIVEYADTIHIGQPTLIPNDPKYPEQWLHPLMQSPLAWDITAGSPNTIIALIDVGYKGAQSHQDFASHIWVNPGEDLNHNGVVDGVNHCPQILPDSGEYNCVDDDGNSKIDDFNGWNFVSNDNDISGETHGTSCAGAAGAIGNNGVGVAGVCWNCKMMLLVGWEMPEAIEYAVDNGADVISISLKVDLGLSDAVDYARSQGVVIVRGTGNDYYEDPNVPSSHPKNVMYVAGTLQNDEKAYLSTAGLWADVAAAVAGWTISPTNPAGYEYVGGTSYSTPIVAGVIGLIKSAHPEFSADQIVSIVHSAVDPVNPTDRDGRVGYIGTGRINAYKALQYDTAPVALLNRAELDGKNFVNNIPILIQGTAKGPNFLKYEIYYGLGRYPSTWNLLTESYLETEDGELLSWTPQGLVSGQLYAIKLVVYDTYGHSVLDMAHFYIDRNAVALLNRANLDGKTFYDNEPINIRGTAAGSGFTKYELYYGLTQYPTTWNFLAESYTPVVNGILFNWIPMGLGNNQLYALKLVVYDNEGHSVLDTVHFYIFTYLAETLFESGWPVIVDSAAGTVTIADINGDTFSDIIFGTKGGYVYVIHYNGTVMAGWPHNIGGYVGSIISSAAVGDINGDNKMEIAIANTNGNVYVMNGNGDVLSGWPQSAGGTGQLFNASPVLGDIDSDGKNEVIIGGLNQKILAWNEDGSSAMQINVGVDLDYSPALADMDGDGKPELIIGGKRQNIYIFNEDGTQLPGWPKITDSNLIFATPIAADMNNDGSFEILSVLRRATYPQSQAYIWDSSGNVLPGWPKRPDEPYINDPFTASPLACDVDNDNQLEILIPRPSYIVSQNLDGSYYKAYSGDNNAQAKSICADIDNDNKLELIGFANGYMYIKENDGTSKAGWPMTIKGGNQGTPAAADIDNDGYVELITPLNDHIFVWKNLGPLNPARMEWPEFGIDKENTNAFPKRCTDLTIDKACSLTKPKYCQAGTLINNCRMCGCPESQTCYANGYCSTPVAPPSGSPLFRKPTPGEE